MLSELLLFLFKCVPASVFLARAIWFTYFVLKNKRRGNWTVLLRIWTDVSVGGQQRTFTANLVDQDCSQNSALLWTPFSPWDYECAFNLMIIWFSNEGMKGTFVRPVEVKSRTLHLYHGCIYLPHLALTMGEQSVMMLKERLQTSYLIKVIHRSRQK